MRDWQEGCERCKQILRYGGMGHTMGIHSQNDAIILEFGLKKPAFRIAVNTPTTFGSTGISTGLAPAMTLGCGGYGGNITSDNITPQHLLNIKRLAYEVRTVPNRWERATGAKAAPTPTRSAEPVGIRADVLNQKIEQFLGSRGFTATPALAPAPGAAASAPASAPPPAAPFPGTAPGASDAPLDFVCEDDVRLALRAGRTLLVSERAIITPSARELGDANRIFRTAPFRG